LIAMPGSKQAGRRTDSLAELVDLFPTLVELARLPQPEALEGTSLLPVLRDPATRLKTAAFSQFPRPAYYDREPSQTPQAMGCSVRTPLVRYTEWRDWKTGAVVARELYDAVRDSAEMRNVVDTPALAAAQREAEERLREQFPTSPR
jgi:iduronate 2-sulfatase